mgnify:CR=1 FL=1
MPRGIYIHKKGYKRNPFSEEWKQRIGAGHKGLKAWNKGKSHSKEWCEKLSKAHLGKKRSKEHCESIRKSLIGHRRYAPQNRLSITDPKAYAKMIYKTNPQRRLMVKTCNHRRRIAGCKLEKETIQMVYEDNIKKWGTLTCYLCFNPILFGEDHLEHKIPISRGGTNEYNNLAISCKKCNRKKYTKTEEEFRKVGVKPD